jgi:vitamin B12 transporter
MHRFIRSFRRWFVALATLAPLSPFVASAQTPQLEPVVVTATRTPQPVAALVSDVRIIDRDALAAAGGQTLLDVLRAHGGVEIAATGGPGQPGAVFIRGSNANHVVVLIDGVRINSATAGTNAFENIPLDQIERIEIVRGPASGLYGADAIGGVIQIFTKAGADRIGVTAGAGTWDTQRAAAGIARTFGSTRLALQAGYAHARSFSATNARNAFSFDPDDDPYRNRNAGGSLAHTWAPGHEITLRGFASEGTTHFDAGPGTDDVNTQRLSSVALESRDPLGPGWTSTLRLARGADDLETTGSFPSTFRTDQDQATWQHDVALPLGTLAAGLEFRRERVSSTTDYSAASRTIRALFAGWAASAGPHLVQVAARHDDNSQFGGRTTGNAGYGYRLGGGWRASVAAGTAFKAPSFNDLYFLSPFFSGNPDLQPERSRSVEAALRYEGNAQGRTRAGLTVFENRIRDLIAVDSTFTTVVNVNEARIRGATLTAGVTALAHRIDVDVTRQDPVDVATGRQLVRRAKTFGTLRVSGERGPWRWLGEVVANDGRFDSAANAPASRLAGYALLNLRLAYALTPKTTLAVRWDNVLDRGYELVGGYNTPRSNVFASIDHVVD